MPKFKYDILGDFQTLWSTSLVVVEMINLVEGWQA